MDYTFNTEKRPREKEIVGALSKEKKKFFSKGNVFKHNPKIFLYFVTFVLLAYLLFFSPIFHIQNIKINDLKYTNEALLDAKFTEIQGQNFFLSDLSRFRQKLVKEHVFIDQVYTEKIFPRTVIVEVIEKEPFLMANSDIHGCYLIDNEGYVLSDQDCDYLQEKYRAREITGEDIDNFEFEEGTQSNFYMVKQIYYVNNVIQHYGYRVSSMSLNNQVLEINIGTDRSLFFSLANDLDVQLKRFIILIHSIDTADIDFSTMDLRFERPVLKE